MHKNIYRDIKTHNLWNGCLLVDFSLIFVVVNIFMTTWLPVFGMHERSIRSFYGEYEFSANKYDDNHNHDAIHVVPSIFMQVQSTLDALVKAHL